MEDYKSQLSTLIHNRVSVRKEGPRQVWAYPSSLQANSPEMCHHPLIHQGHAEKREGAVPVCQCPLWHDTNEGVGVWDSCCDCT